MEEMDDLALYEYIFERKWNMKFKWQMISDKLQWGLNEDSTQKRYRRLCDKLNLPYKPKKELPTVEKRFVKDPSKIITKIVNTKPIIDMSKDEIDEIPYGEIEPTLFKSSLDINDWIAEYIDFFDGDYDDELEFIELCKEWVLDYLKHLATTLWIEQESANLFPRGYGKTETTLAVFVRWFVEIMLPLYIVSPSSSHSSTLMDRIESHCYYWKLRRDYGDIFGNAFRSQGNMHIRYTDSVDVLHKLNLKIDKPITFVTFSSGKKGRHPAWIHFEDVMQEIAVSEDTMDRIKNKLNSTYFKMFTRKRGKRTKFSMTGTRYDVDDMYKYIIDRRKMLLLHYKALEADNKTMLECPNYTLQDLLDMKAVDPSTFETEMNNNPIPSTGLYFKEKDWIQVPEITKRMEGYYVSVDPAGGMGKNADNTSITVAGLYLGKMYIVDGFCGKVTQDEILMLIEYFNLKYNPFSIFVEKMFAVGVWLHQKLGKYGNVVPYTRTQSRAKYLRIDAMKSYFKKSMIIVLEAIPLHDDIKTEQQLCYSVQLNQEYLGYNQKPSTATRKDDCLDSLSMLVDMVGSYLFQASPPADKKDYSFTSIP